MIVSQKLCGHKFRITDIIELLCWHNFTIHTSYCCPLFIIFMHWFIHIKRNKIIHVQSQGFWTKIERIISLELLKQHLYDATVLYYSFVCIHKYYFIFILIINYVFMPNKLFYWKNRDISLMKNDTDIYIFYGLQGLKINICISVFSVANVI